MYQRKRFFFRGKGYKTVGIFGFIIFSTTWIVLNQSVTLISNKIDILGQRNMQEVLAIDTILHPPKEVTCPERRPLLTIIVYSALLNFEARKTIRKTWAQEVAGYEEILLLFLVGRSGQDRDLQLRIEEETAKNQDIVQGNFEEHYLNLTLKTGFMLKWLNTQCDKQAVLILKIDDDVFLNWQNFGWFLCDAIDPEVLYDYPSYRKRSCTKESTKTVTPKDNLFTGYLYKSVEPIRDPMSKWYLPRSLYSSDFLPDFISGTAYIFSGNLVEPLYRELVQLPYFYLEDVFISGICTKHLDVTLTHAQGFNRFKPLWFHHCSYRDLITAHGLTPSELDTMWEGLRRGRRDTCRRLVPSILLAVNRWYLS